MKTIFDPSRDTLGLLCCVIPTDTGVAAPVRTSVIQRPPFGAEAVRNTITARRLSGIQASCVGSSCGAIPGIFGKSRCGWLPPSGNGSSQMALSRVGRSRPAAAVCRQGRTGDSSA